MEALLVAEGLAWAGVALGCRDLSWVARAFQISWLLAYVWVLSGGLD